jgi:hypothetical protein
MRASLLQLDVLVGNAGVAISGSHFDISVVKDAFATNYWGNKSSSLSPLSGLI